jgi:DegV family protein with EDD domain
MLVYLAAKEKEKGSGLDSVAKFVRKTVPAQVHWFTVDDLEYLKRGGRVSSTVAFVGGLLGIKPILHVDDEGKLVAVEKVRGRKAALRMIADKYSELALDKNGVVFISHGDCDDDVAAMKALLEEQGAKVEVITYVGPVIGAHSGPGTLAVFYLGKNR